MEADTGVHVACPKFESQRVRAGTPCMAMFRVLSN